MILNFQIFLILKSVSINKNLFTQCYMLSSTLIHASIFLMHRLALTDTNTLAQSGPGSNGDERVLHTSQMVKIKASLQD